MPAGVYIHIPFCLRKCLYCDFYSVVFNEGTADAYADAVIRNIRANAGLEADTLYFGGGTPVLMGERLLTILAAARAAFGLENAEISMEANPGVCEYELLARLREGGINRISIGLQSAQDAELAALGRLHTAQQGLAAVEAAKRAGFEDISADIMLGIPLQTKRSLSHTLEALLALPLTHVSAYMLKIEEGTPFGANPPVVPGEDTVAAMYLQTVQTLARAGIAQYEISNFAKAGFACRHNLKYWRCEEYLGIGPAAHSYLHGTRFGVGRDLGGFLAAPAQETYVTDASPAGPSERAMLALRLTEGMALSDCDRAFIGRAQALVESGYAHIRGGRLALTPQGMLVSDGILSFLNI